MIGPLFLLQVQGEFSEACEPVRSPFRAILQANSLGLTFSQGAVLSLPQLSRTLIERLTKHRRERTGDNVPRFEPVSIRFPRSSSPTASLALCASTAPLPVIGGVAAVVCYRLTAGMASSCTKESAVAGIYQRDFYHRLQLTSCARCSFRR